jgi:hypothetical protein
MPSKWKMVSFRLSTEEYAAVQASWRAAGYRSISSYALCAMRAFVPVVGSSHDSGNETSELKRRVEELATDVRRLSESVREEQARVCAICSASLPGAGTGAATAATSDSKP